MIDPSMKKIENIDQDCLAENDEEAKLAQRADWPRQESKTGKRRKLQGRRSSKEQFGRKIYDIFKIPVILQIENNDLVQKACNVRESNPGLPRGRREFDH